jgi:hypothetical protein
MQRFVAPPAGQGLAWARLEKLKVIVERTLHHGGRGKAWLVRAACLGEADRVGPSQGNRHKDTPAHVDSFSNSTSREGTNAGGAQAQARKPKQSHSRHTHLRIWDMGQAQYYLARTRVYEYEYESESERKRSVVIAHAGALDGGVRGRPTVNSQAGRTVWC